MRRLLAEEVGQIARELYLSILIDRATGRPTVIASAEGGMDIEEVAARTPDKIVRAAPCPVLTIHPPQNVETGSAYRAA